MADFIPTDAQWELMKKHIKGNNYKKEDFFVFETLAVGDKIVPNRYMRLTPALLEIMKQDAQRGVSLMLNHNWSQEGVQSIPIGKVFDARIAPSSQEGETVALYTTQYILRDDSKVDGYSKNDIIKLIESGILSDTSVGWGTTREAYKCSICGNSIYDYSNCKHIPGQKYIVNEDTNEVEQCIIEANPPRELHAGNNVLMENSVVFDGAYPNAVIQSSIAGEVNTPVGAFKQLNGKENLSEKDIIIGYSMAGNVNLLYKKSLEKGGLDNMDLKSEEKVAKLNSKVAEAEKVEETNKVEGEVEKMAKEEAKVEDSINKEGASEKEDVESLSNEEVNKEATFNKEANSNEEATFNEETVLSKAGNICETFDQLVEMAKEGLEHRNEVIKNALDSGVHSMGNSFDKDIFTKTFSNMKTEDIEKMGNAWEAQAKAMFEKEKISTQNYANDSGDKAVKIDMKQFKTGNY